MHSLATTSRTSSSVPGISGGLKDHVGMWQVRIKLVHLLSLAVVTSDLCLFCRMFGSFRRKFLSKFLKLPCYLKMERISDISIISQVLFHHWRV